MSHTIRNERTKSYLDVLAKQRKERKVARDLKAIPELNSDDIWDYVSEIE